MSKIPHKKLREGAKLCLDNSIRLTECAQNILDKFPCVASFLANIACEEAGKGIKLMENCEKNRDLPEKDWRKLKDHRIKLGIIHKALFDPYSVLKPPELSVKLNKIEGVKKIVDKMTKELKVLKEGHLYVDWNDKEGKWEMPAVWNEKQGCFIYKKGENAEHIVKIAVFATRLLGEKLREEKEERREN